MSFTVDHDALDRAGAEVSQLRDDAASAAQYVDQWLALGHMDTRMFVNVKLLLDDVAAALRRDYAALHDVVDGSGAELSRAAQMYRTTDRDEAARLDETY